jgi:hypothetical protein
MFLFVLRNVVRTIDHLIAQRMHPSSVDDEFVGMMDYITESFHDLLTGDSEAISDSDAYGGSHHPLHECFMAGTPKEHVESVHEGGANSPTGLDDKVEGDARALPCMWVEQ